MSKAAKQGIILLIVLLVASLGFAGYVVIEKQKIESELTGQIRQAQEKEKTLNFENSKLSNELKKTGDDKFSLEKKVKNAEKQIQDLLAQINDVTSDRDKLKERVENIRKERDDLTAKVKELTDQQAAAAKKAVDTAQTAVNTATPVVSSVDYGVEMESSSSVMNPDDTYWAPVLKEKAALQVKVDELKGLLSKNSVEIVELKQKNSDLQIEIDKLNQVKADIEREIKYKEDMVNNLSLELARAKNDKKFVAENFEKINNENVELRNQLKQLVSSKSVLEKSIVRMADDKSKIEKKLGQSETIVQSKIDEIWQIKDSLDKTIKDSKAPDSGDVELPPIVVSSDGPTANFKTGMSAPGFNGKVVSINQDNNFVILNIGEDAGVRLGDTISVYSDSKYIARLEVIQVRKDICAADIKDQRTKIKVGDIVR